MSCSRCGSGNKRPTPPPSSIHRPGTMVPSPSRTPASTTGNPARDAINNLRYVPGNFGR